MQPTNALQVSIPHIRLGPDAAVKRVLASDNCWCASPENQHRRQSPERATASTHLALSPDGSLNDSLLVMLLLLPLLCALGSPEGHSELPFAIGAQCIAAARRLHLHVSFGLCDWYQGKSRAPGLDVAP